MTKSLINKSYLSHAVVRRSFRSRRGLILLVVLGMLAMFSLLVATYIIFTARSRQAATAIARRETRQNEPRLHLDQSISQILRGTTDINSALYGHSLGDDYYGRDLVIGKVLDMLAQDQAGNRYIVDGRFGPEVMMGRGSSTTRTAQMVKIPVQVQEFDPSNPNLIPPSNPPTAFPFPYNFDDSLTGRYLTFSQGPLAGLPLEIVRSFADIAKNNPALANRNSVVVDLGPYLEWPITVNNQTEMLRDWLPTNLNLPPQLSQNSRGLFYQAPALMQGYAFHITPRPGNGQGYGWMRQGNEFNLNQTISTARRNLTDTVNNNAVADVPVPVAFQGHHRYVASSAAEILGATDEGYDVPDYHDYLLGYFPPASNQPLAGLTAPSGIRPAMLNYLVNYFGTVLQRNSSGQITINANLWTPQQRLAALRMLQRASLRPIPVINGGTTDLSGGEYANFTGSNFAMTTALKDPINVTNLTASGTTGTNEARRLIEVYAQLIYGPWDVDNDGDGITDSVWMDLGYGLVTMPDGTLVKPLVAIRVEDLDNRLDLNVVDSSASLGTVQGQLIDRARANVLAGSLAGYGNGTSHQSQVGDLAAGFGNGPAEIVLQGVFRGNRSAALVATRYGADNSPGVRAVAPSPANPPYPYSTGNDTLSVWGNPGRTPYHAVQLVELFNAGGASQGKQLFPASNFGFPMDLHGNSLLGLDIYGQPITHQLVASPVVLPFGTGVATDAFDSPYEMLYKKTSGADFAYSVSELEPVLRYRDWDRNEQPGRLRTVHEQELAADEQVDTVNNTRPLDDPLIDRDTLTRAVTTVSATSNVPSTSLPVEGRDIAPLNKVNPTDPDRSPTFNPVSRLALSLIMTATDRSSDTKFKVLFPPELRRGERLNVNRPLGNSLNFDDPSLPVAGRIPPLGNLTIDDPMELLARTDALFTQPMPNPNITLGDFSPQTGVLPYGSDPSLNPEALGYSSAWPATASAQKYRNDLSRAELARHLYVMAMLLTVENNSGVLRGYDYRAETGGGAVQSEEDVRARTLAQWAVNVVDFRDRDAIMTRFQYDPNPFDGWDEDPTLPSETHPLTGEPFPVVWGLENPELVLTENFSFHDRRVKDTTRDPDGREREASDPADADEDMDQIRKPEGSTFIEVYATRGAKPFGPTTDLHASPPPELYNLIPRSLLDTNTNNDNINDKDVVPMLDLGRLAPDGNPVWRIAISQIQIDPNYNSPLDLLQGMNANREVWDDLTFDPSRQHLLSQNPTNNFRYDRIIWFANQAPDAVGNALPTDSRIASTWGNPQQGLDSYRVYFNRFAPGDYYADVVAGLQGGQYAVIGPRRRTYVGAQVYDDQTGPTSFADYQTQNFFDLHPVSDTNFTPGFQAYVPQDNGGNAVPNAITPASRTQMREVVPVLAAAYAPATWTDTARTAPSGIGVNISEPLPLPVGNGGLPQYYREPQYALRGSEEDITNFNGFAVDAYTDYEDPMTMSIVPDQPFDSQNNMPLEGLENTGTRQDFRTCYLQRLADPTAPYNPVLNPYITVDWMPMDLTVFNGEDNNNRQVDIGGAMEWVDPRDEDPFGSVPNEQFASRSKNGTGIDPQGTLRFQVVNQDHVLWSYGTQEPVNSSAGFVSATYRPNFSHVVVTQPNPTLANQLNRNSLTMGYLNYAFWTPSNAMPPVPPYYIPATVDASTEMFVGAPLGQAFPWLGFMNRDFASPMELMMVPASSPDRLMMEFTMPGGASPNPYGSKNAASDEHFRIKTEFSHLLNFFSHNNDVQLAPNLHRLFDYLETPDLFIESKEMLEPLRLQNPETARELEAMAIYFPPLNFVTKELRAGRVNLNTVNNPLVWRSLMWLHSTGAERDRTTGSAGAFWQEWMLNRRGYGNLNSPQLDADIPTQFRGVLQHSDSAWIAPQTKNAAKSLRLPGVQGTLLRQVTDPATGLQKTAFTRPTNQTPERDVRRNSFFRYQTLMRMPNLTSNNSNTFAVWVTIGYFEVDPTSLAVGDEYGMEQGTSTRPRAFYIIDRSVPVDYVPGQDTNIRNQILLERVLN